MDNQQRAIVCTAAAMASWEMLNIVLEFDGELVEEENVDREKPIRIDLYVEKVVSALNDKVFQSHFRISRCSFELLLQQIDQLVQKTTIVGRSRMDTTKQLLATLWILATPDCYRSVGERFNMGKSSLSKAVFRIIEALNMIASEIITWPQGYKIQDYIDKFFNMAGVKNVLGAVDGTFIPIKAPAVDKEVYITRKCNYAITLQAICGPELQFTDCFVGYPGSVSDTRIFRNSDIFENVMDNINDYFPNYTFIVGDKAYPPTWTEATSTKSR